MGNSLRREIQQSKPFSSLEEEVFLALLRTAGVLEQAVAVRLKACGLTTTQYNVLRILRGSEPEPLTCGEVGKRMVTPVPDVTRLVDRLERSGLARRERAQTDRRIVMVRITATGLEVLEDLDGPVDDWLRDLLGHLSRDELARLNQLLESARSCL
ncbi:MAG: MarR family transcriptional regulator [Acidobacteriota bacterium]